MQKVKRTDLYEFLEGGFKVIKNFDNPNVILKKDGLEITFDITLDKVISVRNISKGFVCICGSNDPFCKCRSKDV